MPMTEALGLATPQAFLAGIGAVIVAFVVAFHMLAPLARGFFGSRRTTNPGSMPSFR